MTTDVPFTSAVDALAGFADGTLSPVELMTSVLECEDAHGALTQRYADEALASAKSAESRWRSGEARPLEGLPVAVKEDKGVEGKPTSAGSLVWKDAIAGGNAPPVAAITAAGGIVHARTNVNEMGTAGITGGRMFPPTSNPYNPEFNSLGSSGGAAVALATGLTTLANGSDYCGSIRLPSSANAVVGFKPSRGRNAVGAYFNLDWYDHDGPMARSIDDCALLQNAMAGQQAADLFSRPDWTPLSPVAPDASSLSIALSTNLGFGTVAPDVEREIRAVAERLSAAGANVVEIDLGWGEDCLWAFRTHAAAIFAGWAAPYLDTDRDDMTDYAIAFAETAHSLTAIDFARSMEIEAGMWDALAPTLSSFDALLCPTSSVASVPLDHNPAGEPLEVMGRSLSADFGWMLTWPFNMLSALPVLDIPAGLSDSGVPVGAQLVGRPFDDHRVFDIGSLIESLSPRIGTFAR